MSGAIEQGLIYSTSEGNVSIASVAGNVEIRPVFAGDSNLDGVINGDDYFNIDAGFAAHASGYANGDFNYDGKINADDYFLIDSNYNKAQTPLAAPVIRAAPLRLAGAEIPRSADFSVSIPTDQGLAPVWDDSSAL